MKTQILSLVHRNWKAVKQISALASLASLVLSLCLVSCTEQKEDTLDVAPEFVTDRSGDEEAIVGHYTNGEFTLNLTFDEAQQVLDAILETKNTSGELLEVFIDDQPEVENYEMFLTLTGELEDGSSGTFGLLLERAPTNDADFTYYLGVTPPQMERAWECKNVTCGGTCTLIRGPWHMGWPAQDCKCNGGSGCEFTSSGGGGAWIDWAISAISVLLPFLVE